jgi:hypothetical protein
LANAPDTVEKEEKDDNLIKERLDEEKVAKEEDHL